MNVNQKSYDKICEQWHDYRRKSKINTCIVDFAKRIKPGGKILDIGCGTGYPIGQYFSDHGFSVTGIDVSKKMLEKAVSLHLPNARFILKGLLEFVPSEQYDGVVAFDSLWYIAKNRQTEIYGLVGSWMKKGAYFLFTHGKTDGEISGEMYGQPFHYSALCVNEVHALLLKNGFRIESSVENYREATTGDRDLLIVAEKIK